NPCAHPLPPPLPLTLSSSSTYLSNYLYLSPNRRPPISTLFPYTTLFRSVEQRLVHEQREGQPRQERDHEHGRRPGPRPLHQRSRSEEHTSELQSLTNLVCRLLLEKKKKDG